MTTVGNVCAVLKEIAPLNLAEEWDNVGLLLGDESASVIRALTCLTLTSDVADEAVDCEASLIVTHHPILFKPVKKLTSANAEGRMLQKLIRHGVSVYSPHTAWDNATAGVNQQLAELLELREIKPLRPRLSPERINIVTFVPEQHLERVRQAMWQVGAGVIGDYQNCSFFQPGTGTFFGSEETHPAVGKAGQLETVEEIRLEVTCPASRLETVLTALRSTHPYEEPAIDVYSLTSHHDGTGFGRFGLLPQATSLGDICRTLGERLRQPDLQYVGPTSTMIQRVGVACGAAGEFLRDAHRENCELFITGEARFHSCLEASELGVAMALPGHYATERFAMETLAARLKALMPGLNVTASERERNPLESI